MATAGTINILIRAVTQDFDKKIAGVGSKVKGLTKGFADVAGAVYVAQQAFGNAQQVVSGLVDEIKRLDDIGDLAARFDITTDAVQRLQRTFELSGGQAEALSRIMGRLQANLGDAANGNTGVSKALERINLRAEELTGISLDRSFEAIVRQISKLPTPAERSAVAMDLLGKSSVEIMEIFTRGNVFEDAAKDVEEFGVKLDKSATEAISRAAEETERLAMAWKSLKGEVTIATAPALGASANVLSRGMSGIRKLDLMERTFLSVFGVGALFARGLEANGLGGGSSAAVRQPPRPPAMLTPPDISARSGGVVHSMLAEWGQLQDAGLSLGPRSGAANPNLPGFGGNPFTAELRRMIGIEPFSPSASGATGGAGAMEFGSLGAYQAIQASKREDESRRLMRQEVEESKKQTKLLERIEDALVAEEVLEPANLQG